MGAWPILECVWRVNGANWERFLLVIDKKTDPLGSYQPIAAVMCPSMNPLESIHVANYNI